MLPVFLFALQDKTKSSNITVHLLLNLLPITWCTRGKNHSDSGTSTRIYTSVYILLWQRQRHSYWMTYGWFVDTRKHWSARKCSFTCTGWRLLPKFEQKQTELHPKKYTYSGATLKLYRQQQESVPVRVAVREGRCWWKMLLKKQDTWSIVLDCPFSPECVCVCVL